MRSREEGSDSQNTTKPVSPRGSRGEGAKACGYPRGACEPRARPRGRRAGQVGQRSSWSGAGGGGGPRVWRHGLGAWGSHQLWPGCALLVSGASGSKQSLEEATVEWEKLPCSRNRPGTCGEDEARRGGSPGSGRTAQGGQLWSPDAVSVLSKFGPASKSRGGRRKHGVAYLPRSWSLGGGVAPRTLASFPGQQGRTEPG